MILPLIARRFIEIGAGITALGMSDVAAALAATLTAPLMGMLADRYGRRKVALISVAVYGLSYLGYLLASSSLAIILIRGFTGALTAGMFPAINGIAAELAPAERRTQWLGIVTGGASVG